jgi:hypothetical protein
VDAELKEKWLKALRSGQYRQGTGRLRTADDCYCALGVLCDTSGKGRWVVDEAGCRMYKTDDWTAYVLPSPDLIDEDQRDEIILLNDGEGKSFAEIADWIEENVSESGATPAPA